MAGISDENGERYVVVSDLVTGRKLRIPAPNIWSFILLTEQRLLGYGAGIESGSVFAFNIDGKQEVTLNQSRLAQAIHSGWYRYEVIRLLRVIPEWSDSVLVEHYFVTHLNYQRFPHPEVQKLNFFTGEKTLVEKNPGNVVRWLADKDGNIRGAVALEKDFVQLLYRASRNDRWSVVYKSRREDLDLYPFRFSPDDQQLYVAAHNGGDVVGLYSFDLATKQIGKCLFRDDQYDIALPLFHRSGAPLGVLYECDRAVFKPLDSAFEKVQASVDPALPGGVNVPVSSNSDGTKIIYLSVNDRDPGSYYLVDTVNGTFGIVGRPAIWIKPEKMAAVRPIQYAARDGVTIHGYLTLPPRSTGTHLPLIVMPPSG